MDIPVSIREKTEAALLGDSIAAGTVFEWYRPRLYAHALRIFGNTPLAQDAVQDTFISAFTHLNSLRDAQFFYPWLKRILLNHCYQLLRKEKRGTLRDKSGSENILLQDSIEAEFEKSAHKESLYHALQFLSEELRSCMLLRYFSSVSRYDDIASILAIPVGTVRSRLAAAREQLVAHFFRSADSGDRALKESGRWNDFYMATWNHIYDNLDTRNEYYNHHHPGINIRFTSGKWSTGRNLLECEINNDLFFGSRFMVDNVTTSGNISVIEGPNRNGDNAPYRCAPSTIIIVFRNNDIIHTAHIFDSPRSGTFSQD